MITLRMLAIAVAILVGLPIAIALADGPLPVVPGGTIVDMAGDAGATVTDIVLVEPPATYDRAVIHNAPEQLVEGHTVFVTWDIPLVRNVTEWNATIVGDISCDDYISTEGEYWMGIPVPTRINEAHVECHYGDQVFVTPDPFYDPSETYNGAMTPTGMRYPFVAPNGVAGEVVEYSFTRIETNWRGETFAPTYYAWAAPVLAKWTHDDGRPKAWYCPIPEARLLEMGATEFTVFLESELPYEVSTS